MFFILITQPCWKSSTRSLGEAEFPCFENYHDFEDNSGSARESWNKVNRVKARLRFVEEACLTIRIVVEMRDAKTTEMISW